MVRQSARARTGLSAQPRDRRAHERPQFDWLGVALLGLFALVSMWLIALNLFYAAQQHLLWTGIDGIYPIDQLQYLAWIHDASQHVLVSDLFNSRSSPHDYLQPMVALSGLLAAAGVAPWVALLIWKPVAILALFLAVRAYCRRLLPSPTQRNVALLLALLAGSYNVLEDEWIPFLSWGYPFDLMSLAALVGALIAYEKSRNHGTMLPTAAVLGALAAWLHPWQGELLIVVMLGSEIVSWLTTSGSMARPRLPTGRQLVLAGATVLATAVPLAYYAALGHFDPVWQAGQAGSQRVWGLAAVGLPLLPLAVLALPAYLRRPASFLDASVRVWPLAALLTWAVNQTSLGAWSVYAWVGITVPLGILVVQGANVWRLSRLPGHRLLAALAIAALTIPGTYVMLTRAPRVIWPGRPNQNLVTHAESRALAYLAADRVPGSVISPFPLGDAVPAETGRHSFVGDNRWTLRYGARNELAWKFVEGRLRRRAAQSFVRRTGARFVLAPCRSSHLERTLGELLVSKRSFGCLTLYGVR